MSWLIHRTGITRGAAVGHSAWAKRVAAHPRVLAALAAGQVSESAGRVICLWTDKLPQEHRDAGDEQLLAAFAGGLGLADLAGLFAEMYVRARGDLPDQDRGREFADREVKLATTLGGAGVMHGDLTAECAAAVAAVLDALSAPAGKDDDRTKGQRYHDALAEAMRQLGKCIVTCITRCGARTVGTVNFSPPTILGRSFTSAAWDLATRQLRLSCGCLHYGSVGTLTADGSSDNTGISAIVHRPAVHATEATWCACLVSPLAASASATVASVCACRSGLVIERATVAACWCWPARRRARTAPSCGWPPPAAAPRCRWQQARRPPEPRDQYRRLTHAHATATGVTRHGAPAAI